MSSNTLWVIFACAGASAGRVAVIAAMPAALSMRTTSSSLNGRCRTSCAPEAAPASATTMHGRLPSRACASALDQAAREGKTDAEPVARVPRLLRSAHERLEQLRERLGREPVAVVAHADLAEAAFRLGRDFDAAARIGEFRRVVDQVRQRLRES